MGFLSSLAGLDDAKDAAEAQELGFQNSINTYEDAQVRARDDLSPYTRVGKVSTNRLLDLIKGDFDMSGTPEYQFLTEQGNRAVDSSGAARGMALSGAQLKGLQKYGQGLANTYTDSVFNRLLQGSNLGMNATNSLVNVGQNTAANIGAAQQGVGAARASGYLARANLYNNQWNSIRDSGQRIGEAWASPGVAMGGA